jgi:hypothetical protein
MAIARFEGSRSPVSIHRDQPFRSIPITRFGHPDHFSPGELRPHGDLVEDGRWVTGAAAAGGG